MRVQPRSHKKTIIITVVILTALLISFLLWYYALSDRGPKEAQEITNSQQDKPTENKVGSQDAGTKESIGEPDEQSVPHEKEKELPQLYEGENINNSTGLTGTITAKSVMAGNLIIRNTIDQMVGGGNCELNLSSGGRNITRSAEIIQNPSSSTCAGFDIPVSELAPGQWNIEIKVSSGDKGMTLKDTVNI